MKKLYTLLSLVLFSFAANAQCTGLFFSEYIEGSSNNKALEIYNASSATIDLSDYAVIRNNNGLTTSPDTFMMNGMLASEGVYIIANPSADAAILALADTTGSATFYNGDDALALTNIATSTVVDMFGVLGVDPGSAWTWNVGGTSYATNNSTLVRNFNVQEGVAVWDTLEWVSTPIDDFSKLGFHSSSCHPPMATAPETAAADPTAEQVDVISLFSGVYTDVTVDTWRTPWSQSEFKDTTADGNDIKKYENLDFVGIETVGANSLDVTAMQYFTFDAWTADATQIRVKLVDWGADNSFGGGDDSEHEITIDNPTQGSWINFKLNLSDFVGISSFENISQLIFAAQPARSADVFLDNIYFSKDPTLVYNKATIAEAVVLNADFAPVREDSLHEITGIVYGVDLQGGGAIQFTLIDDTDGIGVFGGTAVDGYVVNQGDEITIKGAISFFNGLTQISPDSIMLLSTGNALKDATVVTQLSEDTESDLVTLEKVWLVDGTLTEWPTSSTNLDITNGTDTFAMRLDSDIPGVMGKTIDFDTMNITGLGGQFDGSAPYDEGYQLLPRDSADIAEWVLIPNSIKESIIQTRVYPNPATNNITIVGAQKWEGYSIVDVLGNVVSEGTVMNNNIAISGLVNGTYIVRLSSGDQVGVSRFVVNK